MKVKARSVFLPVRAQLPDLWGGVGDSTFCFLNSGSLILIIEDSDFLIPGTQRCVLGVNSLLGSWEFLGQISFAVFQEEFLVCR